MRQPARPAGAARARRPGRRLQSDHAPLPRPARTTASSSSTSAAAAARRRTPRSRPTPPGTSSPTWSACARRLGIERWQVFGGSWGSTLALAYAETHPERVDSLILRGIFLVRRAELQWFYQQGCSWIYPDAFAAYESVIPPAERGDMIAAYHRRLTDPDPQRALEAAKAWSVWEGSTLSLVPGRRAHPQLRRRRLCHRLRAHRVPLLRQRRLLCERRPAARPTPGALRDIPGIIIHGRYDVVTPVKNAWDLQGRVARAPSCASCRRRPCDERAGHRPRARIGNSPLPARARACAVRPRHKGLRSRDGAQVRARSSALYSAVGHSASGFRVDGSAAVRTRSGIRQPQASSAIR